MPRLPSSGLGHSDVDTLECAELSDGFFQLNRLRLRHRSHHGHWCPPIERECLNKPQAVVVVTHDPQRCCVVLVEQFRVGALGDPVTPWLMEWVAGLVEPGHSVEATAHRELMEEAGLVADSLRPVMGYWASPGASSEYVTLCYATVDATEAGGVHGCVTEGEDVRVHQVPQDTAFQAMDAGEVRNASTVLGLQWLRHHLASSTN